MATITTYLHVVDPEEPDSIDNHELFENYGFDRRGTQEGNGQQLPTLTFALEQPLDEAEDLNGAVQSFSEDVSSAIVVLCEVEERFDQVERLQLYIFRDGKRGGGIEHGYVYNVGPGGS